MQRSTAAGVAVWQNGQMWKAFDSILASRCNPGATGAGLGRWPGLRHAVLTSFLCPTCPHDRLQVRGDRAALAGALGGGTDLRGDGGPGPAQVLLPGDAALP